MSPHPPQPTFPILAQDITGDLMVDFWILLQVRIAADVNAGIPLHDAVSRARAQYNIPQYQPWLHHPKLDGAALIACDMRAYSYRRLAD